MWLGRFHVGDSIGLSVLSKSKNGAPLQPSALVQALVYNAGGPLIEAVPLHPKDRFGGNWDFTARLRLDDSYQSGSQFFVLYQWTVSSTLYSRIDVFEVVDGGDADGQVVGMASVPRPEANFVLYQTQSGLLRAGRNPR
jgi:hypothetical protein